MSDEHMMYLHELLCVKMEEVARVKSELYGKNYRKMEIAAQVAVLICVFIMGYVIGTKV